MAAVFDHSPTKVVPVPNSNKLDAIEVELKPNTAVDYSSIREKVNYTYCV